MKLLRSVSTTAALGVAGAGIAIGAVGLSTADDNGSEPEASTTESAMPGPGFGRGPGGPEMHGPGVAVEQLAEALDLDEADVAAALRTVADELRPDAPPADDWDRTRPSEEDLEERRSAFIAALAEELGVSEADLTEAWETIQDEREGLVRDALEERLDDAIEEGSLTEADKASVLKAFDAGVLRGPGDHR